MTISRPMRSDASRNHETILSAAIAVLAGEPNASMREIADASGIGRTTLYRHFPDRGALVVAMHGRVHAEADDTIHRSLDAAAGGGAEETVAVIAQLAAELAGFGDRYRFLQRHDDAAPPGSERPAGDGRRRLLEFLLSAQRDGAVRDDLSADWLLGSLRAIITWAASRDDECPEERARMVASTVASLVRPVTGR